MELHHLSNPFPLNRGGYFLRRTMDALRGGDQVQEGEKVSWMLDAGIEKFLYTAS